MIWDMLGRTPDCFTGGDCWDYHYPTRWLLLFGITLGIVVIVGIAKRYRNRDIID